MKNKILVVDDNVELLHMLRMAFRASGFSVATAKNGIEALKKARSLAPDLILLDLVLPEMDGFAVCETLRKCPETKSIPIILLSGLSSQFARFAGIDSGANEFVNKPVRPSLLVEKIKNLLSVKPAAAKVPAAGPPRNGVARRRP
jgi:two-component system, OmpR family, alkaline phosphatase synthesis response regulator PhoP